MFALMFRFPGGRYHATPWGRHVNEGDVAWPPEPYRILRALIATWHRKADQATYDRVALARLIEALAQTDPVFILPDAVHAHTRHYMPQGRIAGGREDTKLVFDAFFRVDADAELIAAWPKLQLGAELFALACHLAERMNYLGRAEALAVARASADEISKPYDGIPLTEAEVDPGWTVVDVLAPLSAAAYERTRPALLTLNGDKAGSSRRRTFEATVPDSLLDALAVETSQLQAAGWSCPPAGRIVAYMRRDVGPQPSGRTRRSLVKHGEPASTVARLVLAGRPRPRIEEAVKIGEIFRLALMARIGAPVPASISGRDEHGRPLRDPAHRHAFFLPEDDDGDGSIDHIILFVRDGLEPAVRRAVEGLQRLWIADPQTRLSDNENSDDDEKEEKGRREWRLALEGFGHPSFFADSDLLRRSKNWISVTPYLRPWHTKLSPPEVETERMAEEECRRRGLPILKAVFDPDPDGTGFGRSIAVAGGRRNVLHFHRFRSRRSLAQPDRSGAALLLTFAEPIEGPLAFGFGCHFGLGLFRAIDESEETCTESSDHFAP
jgi:CRISPR-associated protein Csb2